MGDSVLSTYRHSIKNRSRLSINLPINVNKNLGGPDIKNGHHHKFSSVSTLSMPSTRNEKKEDSISDIPSPLPIGQVKPPDPVVSAVKPRSRIEELNSDSEVETNPVFKLLTEKRRNSVSLEFDPTILDDSDNLRRRSGVRIKKAG